jgi:lipopolysaccharide export system protein LptA
MTVPVNRLRRWFAAAAILMIALVSGMYLYARWRVSQAVHQVPAKLGLDIQQTAEGFSISKSEQGRTIFTVSASKAVQFKQGARAELHNVKITIFGKDSDRFDRISGDDFEYDPGSGNITSNGRVLIDLEANPEGSKSSDQTPPARVRNPIHVETENLVFNRDSGDATASGQVVFETLQARGSAVGVGYVSKTGTMTLRSSVEINVKSPQPYLVKAESGVITKLPREVVLTRAHMKRANQQLEADHATFFLREDNTVERILAEGNVQGSLQGRSEAHAWSDEGEMWLTGTRNQLTTAVLTGNVRLVTQGVQPADANAGKVTLEFGANQILESIHAENNVRLTQQRTGAAPTDAKSERPGSPAVQNVEMTAPVMDFLIKNGRLLTLAETSGPPQITITDPGSHQKTVVTATKFTAHFTEKNQLALLHGEPNAKIVGSSPGQPDRISTSPTLDVQFLPQAGISTITQAGGLTYASGTQKAWSKQGVYTAADEMLVLTGAPRVVDGSMTTTAETVRFNRSNGDAIADGNVKSTYSDLKSEPNGAMLSSSDPIHVVSRSMTAHRAPAIAVYTGNARLWQDSNVVEAPTLQFDREHRSLVAEGTPAQPVTSVLVQIDKNTGKATPVTITSAHLTYNDASRQIFLTGDVTARGADATMTSRQMTVYLVARDQTQKPPSTAAASQDAAQIEKIVAEKDVVVVQPTRRATGDRLVYTSAEDRFDLTGGPPSIFDAERGKITGDSLTFFRHDDRVLVEGRETSPAVTRTQMAR